MNEIKNKLQLISIFVLLILISLNFITASQILNHILFKIENGKLVPVSEDDASKSSGMDLQDVENIDEVLKNPVLISNVNTVAVDESTSLITFYDSSGNLIHQIPKGYNIFIRNNKIVISGKAAEKIKVPGSIISDAISGKTTETPPVFETTDIIINGIIMNSKELVEITISDENGKRTIVVTKGLVDITTKGSSLKGLTKAELRLNEDGNIVFADFISPNGGDYSIVHNGKNYYFKVGKNGRVVFNPENNRITGEKADLFIDNNRIKISSNLEFTVKLNEKGEVSEIILKGGTFEYDGYVYSKTSNTQGDFHIYLNQDIPKDESIKNAVSVNGDKIQLKGFVKFKGNVNYEAKSQDALTNFNRQFKNFDVLQGDVELSNDKHKVIIKDGKVKLSTENIAEQTGNTQLVNEIDIQIANTYLSSKDFNSAREQYERILSDKNLDSKTQTEARVLLASTLMQQNPTANAKEIQENLRLAGESGKALEDAFVRFHIEQLISISSKEISLTNKETTLIYGEGFLGKIGDGANIALQPVTNADLVLRKSYEVLEQQR